MLPRSIAPPSHGGPRTFALDGSLPKLPLPTLRHTLDAYKQVGLVFCRTKKEEEELETLLKEADTSPQLKKAQEMLEQRHQRTEHYVDEWWTKYGYLQDRDAIVPQESTLFDFTSGRIESGGEYGIPQCVRAALIAHASAQLHKALCEESFPVVGPSISKPYAMNQFRHVYETCRLPGKGCDTQRFYFQTDTERQITKTPQQRTLLLGSNGRFYEISLDSSVTGKPLSVGALWSKISSAQHHSETHPKHSDELVNVGFFTGGNREEWANFRNELVSIPSNVAVLDAIERAMMIISLLPTPYSNETSLSDLSMSRDGGSRWYDKSAQYVVYKNGTAGSSMEHSVMDAAGLFLLHADIERLMTVWFQRATDTDKAYEAMLRNEANEAKQEPDATFLKFTAPSQQSMTQLIRVEQEYLHRRSKVWHIDTKRLQGVGKRILKGLAVSPDSFVQVAFQTTYYFIHGHIPSTYETVGMLPFRLGRTEAGRSATLASRELCEALYDGAKKVRVHADSSSHLATLVRKACEAHSTYIRNASIGEGIDRHIFALKCQCKEAGLPIPAIFDNDLFHRASKWDLSTSHAYVELLHREHGGTSFRPFAHDMTGVVYGIFDECIDCTVITCTVPQYDTLEFLTVLSGEIAKLYALLVRGRL